MIQERIRSLPLATDLTIFSAQTLPETPSYFTEPPFHTLQERLDHLSHALPTSAFGMSLLEVLSHAFQAEFALFCSWNDGHEMPVIHRYMTSSQPSASCDLSLQSHCFPMEYCQQYRYEIVAFPFIYRLKQISKSSYQYWKSREFRSILFIPIWQSNVIRGWIVLGSLSYFQKWETIPSQILSNLQTLSENLLRRIQLEASLQNYQSQFLPRQPGRDQLQTLESQVGVADHQKTFAQYNLSHTALMSIGEAIITTNLDGQITHLNYHAEEMTGMLLKEVQNCPINAALHLINELTGQPISIPILQNQNPKHRKTLDQDVVLIAKDQSHLNIQISIAPIVSESHHQLGMIIVLHDMTRAKQVSKQLQWEARHDPLTGLSNRREFETQLQHELLNVECGDARHVLFFMDLDRFKLVNDSAGHLAGDELLKQISTLLQSQIRTSDLIARMGGDEFCVLLRNCDISTATEIAETMRDQIRQFRFPWNDTLFRVGISMGLVQLDSQTQSLNQVLNAADLACNMAKENGRDRIQIYQKNDFKLVTQKDHRGWGVKIQQALEDNSFQLLFQNIYPIAESGHSSHAEVLMRFNDPHRGLISPSAFLSAAERYDLMPRIDSWVIKNSFKLIQKLQDQPAPTYPTQWMINLSGASLNNDEFLDFLIQQLAQFPGQVSKIGFEITETVAIANLDRTRRLINLCKEQGCQFALDDFGCGVSSFEYLKSLPVDFIKIDGQFISSMLHEKHVKAMVEAINHVGHVMNIKTIAEWVETQEQYELLKNIGIDYIQGFGFHRPQLFTVDADSN